MPSDDRLWWVLTACLVLSLLLNLFLLFRRQILALLHQNGGEVSENEILAMVEGGEESGSIEAIEKEMIENVFEFNNSCAEDLMIHRTDMVSLGVEDSDETILQAIRESGLSRFPVYGEDTDDILGILSTREYFLNARAKKPLPLRELLRPAYFVPESVRADLLFRDMQSKKIHMAVVVDEYGGTSGLITLEDLLEELVGKIYDEFDPPEEQDIIPINDKLWRVSGSADLEDLAKAMEIELPWDELEELDCDTVGGLVFAQLSVIPDDGSRPVVESMWLRIRVEGLCFRYPNGKQIFENASIHIPAGRSTAVIGPSGGGKTTLLDLLLGLLRPQGGHIWYDDFDLVEGRDGQGPCRGDVGAVVSYIPQTVFLNDETVRGNVAFMAAEEDEERIIRCLECAQIWEDVREMPEGLDTIIGQNGTAISGGQRQRIALARALYKESEILIMDEATAALDVDTERAVIDAVRQMRGQKTLLMVTHHMSLAEACERVYRLENRRLVRVR